MPCSSLAAVNPDNFFIGLGHLEFGEYDSGGVFTAYGYVGAIEASVELAHVRTKVIAKTGRPAVPVRTDVTEEAVTVKATLKELNLATLKLALGGGIYTSSTTVTFLDGGSEAPVGDGLASSSCPGVGLVDKFEFGGQCVVSRMAIRFTNQRSCATGKRFIFEGYIAEPKGDLTIPFNETDYGKFDVTFDLIADLTKPVGKRFYQFLRER